MYWRAQQGILYRLAEQRLRLKGRGSQRLHGYTGEQQLHHRVPGQHNALQLPRFAVRLRQSLRQQRLYLRPNAARQRGQAVRLLPGVLDAGDHVRAVGRLCVPPGTGGCHPPCGQIVQPHRHGGGAQIHGGGAAALAGGCSRRIQRLREDAPACRRGQDHLVAVLRDNAAGQPRHAVDADAALAAASVSAAGGGQRTPGAAQQRQQGVRLVAGDAEHIAAAYHADT